ncbi:protein phosphatase 1 regulatory subunit 37-like [Corticium candelabrum]|uniref:protein phosphatase 1 regulatory subunit 37-like n=1 Tax=Corticium candelabrum TaxID=121492 RepID=UPI002E270C2C|nr:protein phosphatase 1 regulatory subunit 37-like [Corticium candelabrum]
MENQRVSMTLELQAPTEDSIFQCECEEQSLDAVAEEEERLESPSLTTPAATPVHGMPTEKRRDSKVRFHTGDRLTRVVELGSPWDNAPVTNKEETLQAYRLSCAAHKMKPLNKVVQQIEAIKDFKERANMLDLKGLRLDNRTCEALEAVFKRVQFVTIDLQGSSLEDDGAMAIFEMIDFYESTARLIVSNNGKLGGRAWLACSKMMKKSPCLEFLDVRNNTFDEYTIPLIGRPIRANCLLRTLHVEGCQLSGRVHLILVAALKTNTVLSDLFLGNNRLIADDMVHLGNILKINNTLQLLDLRDNNIQDDGLRFLCEGLLEQQIGLTSLVLWNNRITPQGIHALAAVLPFHATLETVNLGCNRIESQGCQILKPGMLSSKSLLRLGLVNCKVTCEGAIALAEVIGDNTVVERVDLRDNDIRVAGLMALALAHRVSHHLFRLDMKRNLRVEQRDMELVKKLFEDIERYSQRNKMEHEEREARKAVLKRQQELESQKKLEEEQEEAERRSVALAALSTALHAQALAESQGLPTMPKLDESEIENDDTDRDMSLLLDRPQFQPADEELEMEDQIEEQEGVEIKVDVCEVVNYVSTCNEHETEPTEEEETETTIVQSESATEGSNFHENELDVANDLDLNSHKETDRFLKDEITMADTDTGIAFTDIDNGKCSAMVDGHVDDTSLIENEMNGGDSPSS